MVKRYVARQENIYLRGNLTDISHVIYDTYVDHLSFIAHEQRVGCGVLGEVCNPRFR
jgi:hypothetical protein